MNIVLPLEKRFCINEDLREVHQAYLRMAIFVGCLIYCFANYDTPYLRAISGFAFLATLFWVWVAWRKVGPVNVRRIGALIYDCLIIGLVMLGFGSGFMGMFAVLLWVSIGYGIRYRSPMFLKLGMILTSLTFIVSALLTQWSELGVFLTLLLTLILIPLAMMQPITEMINLLEELNISNRKLDEANQTKARFISDVSHDLLTPVSSIIGYCQLTPPSINGIRINAYQLTRQVRAIIGHSASDDLNFDEPDETFVPADLLKQVAIIVQPLAKSRGITITVENNGVHGYFSGAYHSLSICLMNLANNAVKHSKGTSVSLSVSELPNGLLFEVADDGVGIPADQQAAIFNRFHRGGDASKNDGLGLGLAIVKDTIQRIGGSVELNSFPTGSTFRLQSPATRARQTQHTSIPANTLRAEPAVHLGSSVLFVDDEFQSRDAWSRVLREAGYIVHCAASGSEALAAIDAGNRYDVCVIDYRLPGMNGIEVASVLRERRPSMKLIAISADKVHDASTVFSSALESHLIDVAIQKPLHPTKLLTSVETLLTSKRDQASVTAPY